MSDCWPRELELDGFTYRYLGGLGAGGTADFGKRKSRWLVEWLARDRNFSPQPYEQLAKILREAGDTAKANDILYAGRELARTAAWEKGEQKQREWFRWLGMIVLEFTIGYGLGRRYFRAVWWVLLFTGVGYVTLWHHLPPYVERDSFTLFWASFDQLLPLIELNESHRELFKKLGNSEVALTYFYIHKAVGYILASFIVAGLAGLTQRD